MSESTPFETRLSAALRRHVAAGPTEFDALAFARVVAAAEPRRHGLARGFLWQPPLPRVSPWRRSAVPALVWLLLVALLVAALIGSALIAGARHGPAPWHVVNFAGPEGSSAQLNDVVATGDGYIAVGTAGKNGMVWTSRDGLTWDRLATGDTFAGADLRGLARGDAGLVAVGATRIGPAAWVSADGRTWRRAADVARDASGRMEDVACAGRRCVGVGWSDAADIWTSDDASHWLEADSFPAAHHPGFMPRLLTVVAGDPGFIAAGITDGGIIWTSADGDAWQSVNLAPGTLPSWDYVGSIAVGPGGRVVGLAGPYTLTSEALSTTRAGWISTVLPAPTGATLRSGLAGTYAASVATTAWGYVIVGREVEAGDSPGRSLMWTSPNGLRWSLRVTNPSFDGFALVRVLRCGDALLVVGDDDNGTYRTWAATQAAKWESAVP